MKLFYHKDWRGNFGDDLNVPFFNEMWPNYESFEKERLFGIGTLLNESAGFIRNSVIIGSGYGYGSKVNIEKESCCILGVRGAMTASAIGVSEDCIIGDPAIFLPDMNFWRSGKSLLGQKKIVIAPHHRTSELWMFENDKSERYFYLDPGLVSVENYIMTIANADLVVAEAMHAAIVAAAFGIPFIPVSIRGSIEVTKWNDFGTAINMHKFDFMDINLLRLNYLRRIRLSKVRGFMDIFGGPAKNGAKINSADFFDFEACVNDIIKEGKVYRALSSDLRGIRAKIKNAFLHVNEVGCV